jgi:hypothetical protein
MRKDPFLPLRLSVSTFVCFVGIDCVESVVNKGLKEFAADAVGLVDLWISVKPTESTKRASYYDAPLCIVSRDIYNNSFFSF